MARYDYESTLEYAQQKVDEARASREKTIKDQEKFSKRLLMFDTAVQGANYLINQRADTLKNSLAEERAYLMNAQSGAKKIIEQDNKLIDENKSRKEWIQEQMLEQYRSQIETNVPGLTTQKFKDGKVIEVAKYDIPTSTLANTTLFIDGEEINFNDLVDKRTSEWETLVSQAKSVPSNVKDLDAYVDQYVDKEMPSNLFDWMTRPLRKASKNETSETLQDKLNKSSKEILENPMFSNFTKFQKSLNTYQENFPNQIVDLVNDFGKELKRDLNGNIIDTRFDKIVENIEVEIKAQTGTIEDPVTNKKTEVINYTPQTKITNVDNTTSVRTGNTTQITTGEQILVKLESALLKTYEDILSEKGLNAFIQHPMYVKNPMKAFNDVVARGINEEGVNLYVRGDIDVGKAIENLMQSPDIKEIVGVAQPLSKEDFLRSDKANIYDTYEEYLNSHRENISPVITETLNNIVLGLRNTKQ